MSQPPDSLTLTRRLEANEVACYRSIYELIPAEVAGRLGIGWVEQDGALLVWNRAAPMFLFNRVLALGVFAPATDERIDALLARSRAERARSDVQVTPLAEPPDLAARLLARGLRESAPWLVHHRRLDGDLPVTVQPAGYRVERVTPPTAPLWSDALLAGWSIPAWAAAGALATTLSLPAQPDWSCYIVVHEATGQVVGGGQLFITAGTARLYGDGMRPEHQRHGLQAALIALRLDEARRRGCDLAYTVTLVDHTAQRNMARAGFDIAYARSNYTMPKKRV